MVVTENFKMPKFFFHISHKTSNFVSDNTTKGKQQLSLALFFEQSQDKVIG